MTEMTTSGGGLLIELAVPPNGAEEAFAHWYDAERVPWRQKSAAVVSGGTYQQLGAPTNGSPSTTSTIRAARASNTAASCRNRRS